MRTIPLPICLITHILPNLRDIAEDIVSERLRITKTELASALGLLRESVSKQSRVTSVPTQKRLRDIVEIINRLIP